MTYFIASAYGTSSYTTSQYNGPASTATTSTSTTTTADPASSPAQTGSLLANTGFDIALAIGLASLIIVAAVVVRFWKRPAQTPAQ